MDDLHDGAELGGRHGKRADRVARGDVDALSAHGVAEVLQGCGGGREVLLADVGEEHMLARALAAGDGLPDAAGAGDDEHVLVMSDPSGWVLDGWV